MPQYTQEQANKWYNSLPPGEKEKWDAIGGVTVAGLTAAVNAGVPSAGRAVGASEGAGEKGWEIGGGTTLDWSDAAEPSEWLGKRKPTPAEARKWASTNQDEDFNRYSDRQVAAYIRDGWDVAKGGFYNKYGDRVGKPTESGPNTPKGVDGLGKKIVGGKKPGAGGSSAQAAKPTVPAKPVTYTEGDEALSYTGSPLVDNMIQMFNQAQSQRKTIEGGGDVDRADLGHFARGEDAQVGGGDDLSKLAGMLMGTGRNAFLWTAVDDEAFGGLKGQWKGEAAKKPEHKKPRPPSPAAVANPVAPPVQQTVQAAVDPVAATPSIPTYKQEQTGYGVGGEEEGYRPGSPFSNMLANQFGTGFGNRMYR